MIVGKVSSSSLSLLFPSLPPPLVTLRQPMAWASQWLWASQAECPHVFPLRNRLQTFDFESSLCSTWRKTRINLPNIPKNNMAHVCWSPQKTLTSYPTPQPQHLNKMAFDFGSSTRLQGPIGAVLPGGRPAGVDVSVIRVGSVHPMTLWTCAAIDELGI